MKDRKDYVREFAESHGYSVESLYKILGVQGTPVSFDRVKKVGCCIVCNNDNIEYVRIIIKDIGMKKQKVKVFYYCGEHGNTI